MYLMDTVRMCQIDDLADTRIRRVSFAAQRTGIENEMKMCLSTAGFEKRNGLPPRGPMARELQRVLEEAY